MKQYTSEYKPLGKNEHGKTYQKRRLHSGISLNSRSNAKTFVPHMDTVMADSENFNRNNQRAISKKSLRSTLSNMPRKNLGRSEIGARSLRKIDNVKA